MTPPAKGPAKRSVAPDQFALLERSWNRCAQGIRSRLRRRVHSDDELDDVMQEALIAAYQSFHSFQGRGTLEGWIWKICLATCIKVQQRAVRERRLQRHYRTILPPGGAVMDVTDMDAEDEQAQFDLHTDAVVRLPERQRLVVILRVLYKRSVDETAALMRCSPGTVKASLHVALAKLRKQSGLPVFARRGSRAGTPRR